MEQGKACSKDDRGFTGDKRKDKDKSRKALVKAGDIPIPMPSPIATEVQGLRKVVKIIKAPILLCVTLFKRL
jgi:hypothetical protein